MFKIGRVSSAVSVLVQGLDSAPDVPHAANATVTEGSGVGVSKEPPVNSRRMSDCKEKMQPRSLRFAVALTDHKEVVWETVLLNGRLFVEVHSGILPEGSKERLVFIQLCFPDVFVILQE